jgi:signal peptidase I
MSDAEFDTGKNEFGTDEFGFDIGNDAIGADNIAYDLDDIVLDSSNVADGRGETENSGDADDPDAGAGIQDAKSKKTRMEIFDWLQCVISAIICGIFIFVFVGRTIGVDGKSMLQTLHDNDRVIMSNLFFTPKNGDIIIFKSPSATFGGTPLVKRIIAIAGQTVDINFDTNEVSVDGIVLDEPYINEPTRSRLDFVGPKEVPEGYVFVMGDNRNNSSDSRAASVGLVDTRNILGKVLFVLIPGEDKDSPRDWSRVGFVKH